MDDIRQGDSASGGGSWQFAYLAWTVALVSAAGSLFFSEVMELPPCVLCWYQRIAMFALVIVIPVGIITKDRSWKNYALPLAVIGLVVAVYHNLLYYGIIPEAITPCTEGVPCNARQIEWLGFITIPLMSLGSLSVITILTMLSRSDR